jgi:uncharacterized protein (DUF2141 family)
MASKILLAAATALSSFAAAASPAAGEAQECVGRAGPIQIWVDVRGLRSSEGLVAITVYADDSKRFLAKRGSLYVGRTPARAPAMRICLNLPSTGTFAFAVYHDRNGNRRFDRTGIGLPGEPYGFSNNPSTLFGLPSFSAVRLNVPRSGIATTIRLKHP